MPTNLTLDKAGRIVLPKRLREKLRLDAGTQLQLDNEGEKITLRPVRPKAALAKEFGIWVYQGETSDESISDIVDRGREERIREVISRNQE